MGSQTERHAFIGNIRKSVSTRKPRRMRKYGREQLSDSAPHNFAASPTHNARQ